MVNMLSSNKLKLTDRHTNKQTKCNRVFLEKPPAREKISPFLWNPNSHCCMHYTQPLNPILNMNAAYIFTSYLYNMLCKSTLPSTPKSRSLTGLFLFRFSDYNVVHISTRLHDIISEDSILQS